MAIKTKTVAIIVAAGNGSRMVPITKGGAKELVRVQEDIASIGYSILEALKNGITEIVIVSNRNKHDLQSWLNNLDVGSNGKLIEPYSKILERAGNPTGVTIDVVYQDIPLGLGHAVLTAKQSELLRNHDGFVYILLPDEVFLNKNDLSVDAIGQLEFAKQLLSSLQSRVLTMLVDKEDQHRYGIAVLDEMGNVLDFIEKPAPEAGIESLEAIAGRYLLTSDLFVHLQSALDEIIIQLQKAAQLNQEFKITDAADLHIRVGSNIVRINSGSVTFNDVLGEIFVAMAKGELVSPENAKIATNIMKQVLAIEVDGKKIGEMQLTDAIAKMSNVGIISLPDDCLRLDMGTAEGYTNALDTIATLTQDTGLTHNP